MKEKLYCNSTYAKKLLHTIIYIYVLANSVASLPLNLIVLLCLKKNFFLSAKFGKIKIYDRKD